MQNYDCGFARLDGSWYSDPDCATKVSLCAVCELVGQPVLHLRGMCDQSALDWAFYPQPSNGSVYYEGYKQSVLEPRPGGGWAGSDPRAPNLVFHTGPGLVVGRKDWQYIDSVTFTAIVLMAHRILHCTLQACPGVSPRSFSLSGCRVGEQFTCDTGGCLSLSQRCDGEPGCEDRSDEAGCRLARLPASYERSAPAELPGRPAPNPLHTAVTILNIDSVEPGAGLVGLTLQLHLAWRDHRLGGQQCTGNCHVNTTLNTGVQSLRTWRRAGRPARCSPPPRRLYCGDPCRSSHTTTRSSGGWRWSGGPGSR